MFDTSPILFYIFSVIFVIGVIWFVWYNGTLESENRFNGEQIFVLGLFWVVFTFFIYFVTCGIIHSIIYTGTTYCTSKYSINDSQELSVIPGTTDKYIEYTEKDQNVKYAYYFYTKDLNTNELIKNSYSIKNLIVIPTDGITEAKLIKATNPNNYETYYKESKLGTKTYEQSTRQDSHCLILIVPPNSVVNID